MQTIIVLIVPKITSSSPIGENRLAIIHPIIKPGMYFFVETLLLYPLTIGVAIIGKWFSINIHNIILYSCVYVIAMIAIHYYFYYISKKQADEINELLKKTRSDYDG